MFCLIQGTIYIQDISPPGYPYRIYSTLSTCSFRFQFLCTSDGSDSCGSQLISSPITPSELNLSNDTSRIFTVRFDTGFGRFTYDFYYGVYQLNVECIELDLEVISFKQRYNTLKYSNLDSTLNTFFVGVYTLYGISFPNNSTVSIVPESISFPYCSMHYIGSSNFKLLCLANNIHVVEPLSDSFLTSNINITIKTLSAQKSFIFNPIISKDNYNQISNIQYYPNLNQISSSSLKLFGKDQTALISFTINNTLSNIFYTFQSGCGGSYYYSPIQGDQNSTTFIVALNCIDQVGSTYQLFSQNGGTLKSYLQLSNITINQYNGFQSLQIPKDVYTQLILSSFNSIQSSLVCIGFRNDKLNGLGSIDIGFKILTKTMSFPFGFSNGTASNYLFNVTNSVLSYDYINSVTDVSLVSNLDSSSFSFEYGNFDNSINYDKSLQPTVSNIEVIHIVADLFMYRVYAKIPYKYLYMKIMADDSRIIGPEALVVGTLYEGTFEFIVPSLLVGSSFFLYDQYQNYITISEGQYISISPLLLFQTLTTVSTINITSIQNVSFLYNDLDVTNRRHYNVLYFNFENDQVPKDYPIIMYSSGIENNQNPLDRLANPFYSTYNETIQLFQIQFYVDANIETGDYPFILYFGNQNSIFSGSLNTQLRIKKSKLDLNGPKFKNIQKINQEKVIDDIIQYNQVGWRVTIQDEINGFESGYVVIRGEMDLSIFNITFNSNNDMLEGGNIFEGDYQFLLNVSYPCISQDYIISQVVLYDRMGRVSYYSISPSSTSTSTVYSSILNPFLYYLNDSNINRIQVACKVDPIASLDTTPPELIYFDVTYSSLDTSGPRVQIQVIFQAVDYESGLRKDQYPVIYFNTYNNDIMECKSFIMHSFEDSTTYSCSLYIPVGYANGNPITLSVYGFINNNGLFSGYSTKQLIDLNYRGILNTQFDSCQGNIISTYRFTDRDTDLWVFGRCFPLDIEIYFIQDSTSIRLNASIIYNSAIKISNIIPTNKEFDIHIRSFGSSIGYVTISPIVYDFYLPQPDLSSSSSSSLPTSTPLVTNSPQKCQGTPVCGGQSNGKCTSKGCVCYSPWKGADCTSQIVIIDQPNTNDTSPSTNITLPTESSSPSSTTKVTYKSLITLVSIREIDIFGKVVYSKPFEKWQVKQSDNTTFNYNTTLEIEKNNKVSIASFNATLKWFTLEANLTFADQQLTMNPSTMKYTIEISGYPFDSDLNQLELIMSASIQSNSSDNSVCSVREYGETASGDNSNYLKIQVDNHSLYGRFIKRGIIDSTVRSISNVLLDKDMNSITTTNNLQSFIGIQIPNFKNKAIIDPDFSILIDSKLANSKSNSICSKSSKLSSSKIAGIVIGCIAFIAIVIIIISYHFIKKKKDAKFMASIHQKMKQLN